MSKVLSPPAPVKGAATTRTIRLVCGPTATYPSAVIEVRDGKRSTYYAVNPQPSDFGHAYRFRKLTKGEYVVHECCFENAQDCWCDCPGFERWGHCRHLEAIREFGERLPSAADWPVARKQQSAACCSPEVDGRLCQTCQSDYEAWLREVAEQSPEPPEDAWQKHSGRQFADEPLPADVPF